jgi:DNA helicase-2/ATP-dependent DNA helicase PcrA
VIKTCKGNGSIGQFVQLLRDWHGTRRQALVEQIANEEAIVALDDKYGCLKFLAKGVGSVDEMVKKLEDIFKSEEGIRLSSVHRAKGLEADTVIVIRPDLLPHPGIAKRGEVQRVQEDNLWYVAVTRSKSMLIFAHADEKSSDPDE